MSSSTEPRMHPGVPPAGRPGPRPYRFAPSHPRRPLIRRSHLLRRLHKRWDHRVTVVTAGAGFGKSALLAQALDENALAPRGDDRWLGCGPGDADAACLAEGLATSLTIDLPYLQRPDHDPGRLASGIADGVWARSPRPTCLVLDDVQAIPAGSSAAALLDRLVHTLPTNGHLMLVSRQEPPVTLSRLEAQGRVVRLGEHHLAFDDDELTAFASLRGVPVERLRGLGGWPALAELRTLRVGDGIADFLDEEVLTDLSPQERRAVAIVATIGGADQELLDRLVDDRLDLAELLGRIPLVSRDEQGWHSIHPLWSERLSNWLTPAEQAESQRQAGKALVQRDVRQALTLLIQAGADEDLRHAVRTASRVHHLPTPAGGLAQLYRQLPAVVRDAPEGQLLAGIAAVATDIDRGVEQLAAAARRFSEAGDLGGLLIAGEHLAVCAHWLEDQGLLTDVLHLADALDDQSEAVAVRAAGRALAADVVGDAAGVLAALDAVDDTTFTGHWTAPVAWLRASALLALGFPEAACRQVEVAVAEASPMLRGALSILEVNALIYSGQHDAARTALERTLVRLTRAGHAHTLALGHTVAAGMEAFNGQPDDARHHLARAREHAGPEPNAPLSANLVTAEAAIALGAGDEERAAALLASQMEGHGIHDGRQRYGNLRKLSSLYLLVPETRAQFEGDDLGPCYRLALELAQALAASRERSDLAPAAALTPEHWAVAPGFLPPGWRAELAVAAAAGGRTDADRIIDDLGPAARPTLRRLTNQRGAPRTVHTWARTLLDALPAIPAYRLDVGVLGPITLRRDGRLIEHPHWRRERVRALLLLLVARGGGPREEIAGALWPDLDTDSALRNLRVTLSYLLTALEPDREEGTPSCFVRTDGAALRLGGHTWLRVDAWEMERLLDEAGDAERLGEPSLALDLYRQAVALYRGPYLSDAGYEEWALPHRDRLCARFVGGAVRGGELALAAGATDEALQLASRAIGVEPWSEGAHRLAVAGHLARGDRAAARRAMNTCLGQLDELGVPPTDDTQILLRRLSN